MSTICRIRKLTRLSLGLLKQAAVEIHTQRVSGSPPNEERLITAEYLLQEANEYVAGAWKVLAANKPKASMALSRWVLEASLNLFWTVSDKYKIDERLKSLLDDALRNEALLFEGLAKLHPERSTIYNRKVKEAKKERTDLGANRLQGLENRLNEIKQPGSSDRLELYPLYRMCCAASHPGLRVWERFTGELGSIQEKQPFSIKSTACWMAAASTMHLATFTYCLTELGDTGILKKWWIERVSPLLKAIDKQEGQHQHGASSDAAARRE